MMKQKQNKQIETTQIILHNIIGKLHTQALASSMKGHKG